jgi:hypothetical protein
MAIKGPFESKVTPEEIKGTVTPEVETPVVKGPELNIA